MLWNSSAINGYAIQASDGNIGFVSDMLFEDVNWTVRWLVVDTGNWLSGRKVLLPFSALGTPDRDRRMFPVKLTKQQVKDSPNIDTDMPVSRQNEAHIFDFYGMDPYWGGNLYPLSNAMAVPFLAPLAPADSPSADAGATVVPKATGDPHLRSMDAMAGYHIHAVDGEIGHISDFLVHDSNWIVASVVVDTRNWWPGRLVLVTPRSVTKVDWAERLIDLDINRQTVKASPPYRAEIAIDDAGEERLASNYGPGLTAMDPLSTNLMAT